MKFFLLLLLLFQLGCSVTPVPNNIEQIHQEAKEIVPLIEQNLQPGDIIFRLGTTQLLGGLIDFSKEIAKATQSNFSHAAIVYQVFADGAIIADITNTGVARRYVIDWYLDGSSNIVVKRLKPEYQSYVPLILAELKKQIELDVLYDEKFISDDNRFYCTELTDHCFRVAGIPLAPKIRIKDFPKYNLLFAFACPIGGIDVNSEVALVGNNRIGLFSSDKLETILDLR